MLLFPPVIYQDLKKFLPLLKDKRENLISYVSLKVLFVSSGTITLQHLQKKNSPQKSILGFLFIPAGRLSSCYYHLVYLTRKIQALLSPASPSLFPWHLWKLNFYDLNRYKKHNKEQEQTMWIKTYFVIDYMRCQYFPALSNFKIPDFDSLVEE